MKRLILVLIAMLLVILVACGSNNNSTTNNNDEPDKDTPNAEEVPDELTFGAATVGGVWYTLSGAMKDKMTDIFPDSSVAIVEGGSTANILGLGKGEFDIGFTNGEAISEANEGIGQFDEKINNFSTIATMYPNPIQLIARDD